MNNDFYPEEELKDSLSNFEKAVEYNENKYFETYEFEYIIDYYLSSNDILASRNAIQKALTIHPKCHELQKRLAQLNNIEGFYEQAIHILNRSFQSFGTDKDADYYLILGESYLGIGQIDKAKHVLEKAIQLAGEEYFDIVTAVAILYQQEGYFEEVVFYLKQVEKEDPTFRLDIGISYYNLMDYELAITYLEQFIQTDSFSVDAWYYLAKSYQKNQQYTLAEEAFLNVIALDSDTILYQYNLAKIYIDQAKYIDALSVYKDILSKDKDINHSVFLSIGDVNYNINHYQNAKKNYEIALRLNPESAEAYHSLAQIEIEEEHYDIAKSYVQKAISIDAKQAPFFITLGTLNQLLGDFQAAEFSFIEAINIDSTFELAWHSLIDYYFFLEKPLRAIDVAFDAKNKITETYILDCKIAAAYFDIKNEEYGLIYLQKAFVKDAQSKSFFLEYYPEGVSDYKIMDLIESVSIK